MTAFSADIISPQFPCGAAWLGNALLELGVALPELWGFDTTREWQSVDGRSRRYVAHDQPWRQTLASLRPGRLFSFHSDQRVRFTHALPWQLTASPRRVLMLRDPRDALYSEWQRQRRNMGLQASIDLLDFAQLPFHGGPISNVDMLWLCFACWLDRSADPAPLLLRFEDCKRAPHASLELVAKWLALPTATDALDRAVEASRVEHLQHIEAELAASPTPSRVFNRAGQAFEWRQRWPAHWHRAFGPHWRWPLAQSGYPPLLRGDGHTANIDLDRVLSWRDLNDPRSRAALIQRLQLTSGLAQEPSAQRTASPALAEVGVPDGCLAS